MLCPRTQHNVPSQGLNPDCLTFRDKCNNHEATHLPQFATRLRQFFFFWSEILCRLQSCTTKTSFASHCKSLEIKAESEETCRALRKQPPFSAAGPSGISRETPLGPGAKKDGCFRRLGNVYSTESEEMCIPQKFSQIHQ